MSMSGQSGGVVGVDEEREEVDSTPTEIILSLRKLLHRMKLR